MATQAATKGISDCERKRNKSKTHNELLLFCGRDRQKEMEKERKAFAVTKNGACLARESKTKLNCQGNKSKDIPPKLLNWMCAGDVQTCV